MTMNSVSTFPQELSQTRAKTGGSVGVWDAHVPMCPCAHAPMCQLYSIMQHSNAWRPLSYWVSGLPLPLRQTNMLRWYMIPEPACVIKGES